MFGMGLFLMAIIAMLAFICEYIDSSSGMGYGTILSPVLIIVGYDVLLVVPSVLISQGLAGFSASRYHHKFNNVNLHPKGQDVKVVYVISVAGVLAIFIAVFMAISLPKTLVTAYIGLLVIVMGLILLSKAGFNNFSMKKAGVIGVLSSFNKAISGGGFGPIVTGSQVISGNKVKSSVGITTAAEVPICMISFFFYVALEGLDDFVLPALLIFGALLATPLGPVRTMKFNEVSARKTIGILLVILGVFTLIKTF